MSNTQDRLESRSQLNLNLKQPLMRILSFDVEVLIQYKLLGEIQRDPSDHVTKIPAAPMLYGWRVRSTSAKEIEPPSS